MDNNSDNDNNKSAPTAVRVEEKQEATAISLKHLKTYCIIKSNRRNRIYTNPEHSEYRKIMYRDRYVAMGTVRES